MACWRRNDRRRCPQYADLRQRASRQDHLRSEAVPQVLKHLTGPFPGACGIRQLHVLRLLAADHGQCGKGMLGYMLAILSMKIRSWRLSDLKEFRRLSTPSSSACAARMQSSSVYGVMRSIDRKAIECRLSDCQEQHCLSNCPST